MKLNMKVVSVVEAFFLGLISGGIWAGVIMSVIVYKAYYNGMAKMLLKIAAVYGTVMAAYVLLLLFIFKNGIL